MVVFVAQTRSRKLIARLAALGIGECTQPPELPPRRRPWFYDNHAFFAWRSGLPYTGEEFFSGLCSPVVDESPPVFGVCPDLVAGGLDSLAFSLRWLERCVSARPALRFYLAVQDGMTEMDVRNAIAGFSGIFVGGSLPWKVQTGAAWVRLAHELGLPCHIGRVGTAKRVRWAKRIGADSIDSALPLWSERNLTVFLDALDARQGELSL